MSHSYVSEQDFVSQYILPQLRDATRTLSVETVSDFSIEKRINGGRADLTIERAGNPVFVLEAKFKRKTGKTEWDIEPRDPEVVQQAVSYAVLGGFPYYATCNAKRIVLFKLQAGVKLFESEIASFEYAQDPNWSEKIIRYIYGFDSISPKPLDDTLVDLLVEAHHDLYPDVLSSLKRKLDDELYYEKFILWVESQGLDISDDNLRLLASQATYLEINKFLFYHIIRLIYPELRPFVIEDFEEVSGSLEKFYDDVLKIDYAPIYEKTILSEIPFTQRAEERIRTLLDTLNLFDFSEMDSDFIGTVYEKLIPPKERKRLGQFYTPNGIVDYIVSLTINNPKEFIIDPGCGSGSFLVRSYHRIRELKGIPADNRNITAIYENKKILEQVYGVDINQFPAHLSVINLAVQNPYAKVNKINVLVEDFFNVRPGVSALSGFTSIAASGEEVDIDLPPFFDVVIGNPPYIRHELLGTDEKEKIFNVIESEYNNQISFSSNRKNIIKLKKQSDIYLYFFIHGLKFIQNGGRLGYITSNKWFEVAYGIPLQRFLLKNTKIQYIVEFDRAVFPDADVNTAITILIKEDDEEARKSNLVKFIRFKSKMSLNDMIKYSKFRNESMENDEVKINIIKQEEIELGKWSKYIRAPQVYFDIAEKSEITKLGCIADVSFGLKTGYNSYFVLDKDQTTDFDSDYIKPLLNSPKDIDGIVLKKQDIIKYVLYVHEHKSGLKNAEVLSYIEYGEKLRINVTRGSNQGLRKLTKLESVKGHTPYWYSVPQKESPDFFIAQFSDKNLICVYNETQALASDNFLYVNFADENDGKIVYGYMISSLGALCGELNSRSYGGGVLKMQTYEAKDIPVINPKNIPEKKYNKLLDIVNTILEEGNSEIYHNELDKCVFDLLDLSKAERLEIINGLSELQEIRRLRSKQ
jgi:hypothetical protein